MSYRFRVGEMDGKERVYCDDKPGSPPAVRTAGALARAQETFDRAVAGWAGKGIEALTNEDRIAFLKARAGWHYDL